jgi:hypothetical protein
MKTLYEYMKNGGCTGLDGYSNYAGTMPELQWLVVMVRTRDSDVLTESNWDAALERLGGESESVEVHSFGHWACGWFEVMAVRWYTNAHAEGSDIRDDLDSYPILDEDDFSNREMEEADRVWKDCFNLKERFEYFRNNRSEFEPDNLESLMDCMRGKYFLGYASSLLN